MFRKPLFSVLFCPAYTETSTGTYNKRGVTVNEPIDHTSLAGINIDKDFSWFDVCTMAASPVVCCFFALEVKITS